MMDCLVCLMYVDSVRIVIDCINLSGRTLNNTVDLEYLLPLDMVFNNICHNEIKIIYFIFGFVYFLFMIVLS